MAVRDARQGVERQALIDAAAKLEGVDGKVLEEIGGTAPITRFPSLATIAEGLPPIEWMWKGWVPKQMLTLLGGFGGVGKSYVALDLARRVIAGEMLPDGNGAMGPGVVVYVDAEALPQVLDQRARAWGLDRRQLFVMLPQMVDEDRMLIDFTEEKCQDFLFDMVFRLQPLLVVVDSLRFISLGGENSVEDVRELLAFLNAVVQQIEGGLILVHHLRKPGKGAGGLVTMHDFAGSGHIVAVPRSVIGLSLVQTGPEFDRNGPRRMEVVKTNLCAYPEALGLQFVSLTPEVARLEYCEAPQPYRAPTMLEECGDWLRALLETAEEPLRPREVVELAKKAGYSRAAVYRVRDALEGEVVNTKGRQHPENGWTLACMLEDEETG